MIKGILDVHSNPSEFVNDSFPGRSGDVFASGSTLLLGDAEDFKEFSALLRRHGFGELQHHLDAASVAVAVDARSLWTLSVEADLNLAHAILCL